MFYQNRLENKYKNLLRSETSMASLIKFLSKTILCFFLIQNWQFSPASEGCWLKEGNAGCLNNYLWIEKENNASHIVQSRRWNSYNVWSELHISTFKRQREKHVFDGSENEGFFKGKTRFRAMYWPVRYTLAAFFESMDYGLSTELNFA